MTKIKIVEAVTMLLQITKQPIRIVLGESDYNQVQEEIKQSAINGEQTVEPEDRDRVAIATFVRAESLNLGPTSHFIIIRDKDEQTA